MQSHSIIPLLFFRGRRLLLCFQCVLKSILHEKTANELLIIHYTWLCACTKQLLCDHAASPRISANSDYSTALKSIMEEVNRAIAPHCTLVNFSTRAVTVPLLLHTSCISLCTILWNVLILCAHRPVDHHFTITTLQAPIQVFGIEGRYAHALFSAASKKKSLEKVEQELNGFQVYMDLQICLKW